MRILFTCGDCNGIGIEVLVKALRRLHTESDNSNITFGIATNPQTFVDYCTALGFDVALDDDSAIIEGLKYSIIKCLNESAVQFGREELSAGRLVRESLELAADACLRGEYDAVVTMPVSKSTLHKAGFIYPGQTEFFAHKCSVSNPLMVLCHDSIRVALTTIHEPLANVAGLITSGTLYSIIESFNSFLQRDCAIHIPCIAVLGLNPHAGENGHIGSEEQTQIIPAIERVKQQHINACGPFAADGFFAHGDYKNYDGIVAMYHDQGLIPLKLLAHGAGVNFTAGLPIIRTSPDHGTAFAIAGRNIADESSVVNAVKMAVEVVGNRRHTGRV